MKRFLTSLLLSLLLAVPAFGQRILKQSTATARRVHLSNATTGAGITGATVANITAFIKKHSDTASSTKTDLTITASGGSNDCIEIGLGDYDCELTTGNTDTVGPLEHCYAYTGAVTICKEYLVVPSAKWTEMVATGPSTIDDLNETDCSTIASTTSPMGKICGNVNGPTKQYIETGTADSGTTTTMVDAARTEANTDHWAGDLIHFTSGAINGETRTITGFNAATDTITFTPATTAAVSTETYEIRAGVDFLRPTVPGRTLDVTSTGGAGIDWANVEAPTSTVTLSGTTIGTATNLTNLPTIPTNWITAGGINADAFTAAKFAADASTEFATTFLGSFIEGTTTLKQSAQYWNSALVGKYNSSAGTFNFRDIGDTKNRVVYTTTATSRATVTLSPD
jgi:hypothetical protein